MKDKLQYHNYLLAFIDVLGQKEAFKDIHGIPTSLEEKEKLIEVLKQTVEFVKWFRNHFRIYYEAYLKPTGIECCISVNELQKFEEIRKTELIIHGFSDFVEIFSPILFEQINDCYSAINNVYAILTASGSSFLLSLYNKHALRGGIEVAPGIKIFNDEIYGPVLNEAYKLESQKAQYPRILIGNGLMRFLNAMEKSNLEYCREMADVCLKLITTDSDGLQILDYLGDGFKDSFRYLNYQEENNLTLDEIILKAFDFVRDEKDIWEKEKENKLADRYALLYNYFLSREVN